MPQLHHVRVGHLVDGSCGPIQKDMLLTVNDGVFTAIERFSEEMVPDPAAVADLSLCTILPPLIDCHTHLSMSGTTDQQTRKEQLTANYDPIRHRIAEHIHYHFTHGVLAVRDGGDQHGHVLCYKNEPPENKKEPVIIKAAGKAWHKKGRYGAFIGRHPQDNETLATAFSGENDGVDHVKLINSGLNSLSEFGRESSPQFSLDELQEFAAQVKKRGLKLMVHANGRLPVRLALEAGCHSIEHGFFMGKENLRRMAETQTTWVPTAVTMKACAETLDPRDTLIDRRVVERTLEHQLEQIALAKQYGVTIALGTDAGSRGVLHGESVIEELKLIMKAGYSLTEAIQCATSNGAQLLGIDETGIIAKGKPAHFLVARATPAMLPRKLSYLEGIYLNGTPCNKEFFCKI